MAQEWFALSLDDGSLKLVKEPAESKPVRWIERDLENILALNPDFLKVADHLPLRLGGVRGTVTSPDQVFVDELGRVVVVEIKKVRASLSVISQAMAYADHWRLLPPGEIDDGLREFADPGERAEIFGRALLELRSWADGESTLVNDPRALGEQILDRLAPQWALQPCSTIAAFAQQCWTCERLPFIGAPARIVAIAPSFSDECIKFAEELTQRMVGIELVEVEIVRARGRIYVSRGWAHCDSVSEPTWRLFRRVWQHQKIRDHFLVNGWADSLNRESFSLSARGATDARLWIWASNSMARVMTVLPDGWHKDDRANRYKLRKIFLNALPQNVDASERWLEWEFKLPQQESDATQCLIAVAITIRDVLVPAAPRARPS